MNNNEIKNNPSLSKLRKDAEGFRAFRKVWPILKPFAKMLGVDTKVIDETLERAEDLAKQVDEMTAIPDKFNELFSDKGWILFDSMSLDLAKQAIEIAEKDGLDIADEFLVEYFSPSWVEERLNWLKFIAGFRERFALAQFALEDYKAGRFYASVLLTLSLIDGWVCELNIVDFQRQGFFSDKSQLLAWDSISAHPKGLAKLKEVFGKSRMMTRTDEIQIPFRHGIVHGMDLGYNNKYVAAKCWAALFAVKDWAIKTARSELKPPEFEPKVEKTLWESIESYQKVQKEIEQLKQWEPRLVVVGKDIPAQGEIGEYPPNSPERKMVEFLTYWLKGNYGYMAKCYAPMMQMLPASVRESFEQSKLIQYELLEITEITSATADIKVKAKIEKDKVEVDSILEFRLVCNSQDGDLAYLQTNDTAWGIATWRTAL